MRRGLMLAASVLVAVGAAAAVLLLRPAQIRSAEPRPFVSYLNGAHWSYEQFFADQYVELTWMDLGYNRYSPPEPWVDTEGEAFIIDQLDPVLRGQAFYRPQLGNENLEQRRLSPLVGLTLQGDSVTGYLVADAWRAPEPEEAAAPLPTVERWHTVPLRTPGLVLDRADIERPSPTTNLLLLRSPEFLELRKTERSTVILLPATQANVQFRRDGHSGDITELDEVQWFHVVPMLIGPCYCGDEEERQPPVPEPKIKTMGGIR
jgi:hypothetical protein